MRLLIALRRFLTSSANLYTKSDNLYNYVICRNYAKDIKIKWVRPPKIPSYDPSNSGDLTPFQMPKDESLRELFKSCELIHKTSNENVKKIFSMTNQSLPQRYYSYKVSLVDRVKSHAFDRYSLEVKIAQLTANIRIIQYIMGQKKKTRKYRAPLNLLIHKRRKLLKILRKRDYKKFEWLLEELDLKYYPPPIKMEKVERKKSTKLLVQLKVEKLKELKLGEYKQKLDQQKVPFLEKKLKILKNIKEQESKLQLNPTVADSDIENCIKQIEKVKIQVMENQKKGYVRKVHPYTLEVYTTSETSNMA